MPPGAEVTNPEDVWVDPGSGEEAITFDPNAITLADFQAKMLIPMKQHQSPTLSLQLLLLKVLESSSTVQEESSVSVEVFLKYLWKKETLRSQRKE